MAKSPSGGARGRRRSRERKPLSAPVWAYFTAEERELVDRAAEVRRLSSSSFVAQAALEEAHVVLREADRREAAEQLPWPSGFMQPSAPEEPMVLHGRRGQGNLRARPKPRK